MCDGIAREVLYLLIEQAGHNAVMAGALSEHIDEDYRQIAALGEELGFDEEVMRGLRPGVIASMLDTEFEEALQEWKANDIKVKAGVKGRARWARTVI